MGGKSSPVEKRISFEDGHSSASDEDQKAVEVLFDPTNPYRRKSSLVAADATPHRPRRSQPQPLPHDRAQCIVHQLFEGQRRASVDNHHPHRHDRDHGHAHGIDASEERGLNRIVEPKGGGGGGGGEGGPGHVTPRNGAASSASASYKRRLDFLEVPSDSSDAGQVDEKHWQQGISQSKSEMDIASQHEALHSRLLTKKQLSEMAWGVRELSRRLGSMRLKFKVKTIFLLTKIYDEDLIPKTRDLTRWLLDKDRDVRYTVYVERSLKDNSLFDAPGLLENLQKEYNSTGDPADEEAGANLSRRLRYWDQEICRTRPHTFDFVITLGGDGTVLYASWLFQRIVPPVLSFALGSLGFLTKFDFDEYKETLTTAFNHGVTVGLRLRFEGTIMRSQKKKKKPVLTAPETGDAESVQDEPKPDLVEELIGEEKEDEHTHRPDGTYEILNEIVIDRGPNPSEKDSTPFFCIPGPLGGPGMAYCRLGVEGIKVANVMPWAFSHVISRDIRRRRALHIRPSGWYMCVDTYRLYSLQPSRRWLALPPREPGDAGDGHLRAYALLPTHHPARHHCAARGRALLCPDGLVGQLRRPRAHRAPRGRLRNHQRQQVPLRLGPGARPPQRGLGQQHQRQARMEHATEAKGV
ncbi:hypothetical protein RB597_003805 [Gaeumannomyces tritici]